MSVKCRLENGLEWVRVHLMLGVTLQWVSDPSKGEVEILLVS